MIFMHMRNRTLMISVSVAVVVVAIAASAALAATRSGQAASMSSASGPGWSVSASVATSGSSEVAALIDTTTGTTITCSGGVRTGFSFTRGMQLHRLATLDALNFGSCALPDGTAVTVTANKQWNMLGTSFDPRRNLGVTSGHFARIDINVSSSTCSGVLDGTGAGAGNGTANYQYYNNPGFLIGRSGGNLHIYNISGCTGLFNTGDTFTLSYTMSIGTSIFISKP